MEELIRLGISENTIKNMVLKEKDILNLSNSDIKSKIESLRVLGCSDNQIICIIGSNPYYLLKDKDDYNKLINCLEKYGFKYLNILFDSNPLILSLDAYEIENYINSRLSNESLEDIVDDLETNTYLFNEM